MDDEDDTAQIWTVEECGVRHGEAIGGANDGAKAVLLDFIGRDGAAFNMALILQDAVSLYHRLGQAIDHCYDQSPAEIRDEIDAIDEYYRESTDDYDCD